MIARSVLVCVRFTLALLAASLALLTPAVAQQKLTLHLGTILAPDHPSTVAAEDLAKAVAIRSKGSIDIKVYPSSQLAGLREGTEGVRLGTIDMFWSDSGTLGSFVPALGFVSLPFLFTDYDQAIRAMDKLRPDINRVIRERLGAEPLSWSPIGFRVIITKNRAIRSAADMKGLKLRVPEIPIYVDTFRELRTNATPLAWGEVYTSLQSGVIEGVEGATGAMETSKFHEVGTDVSRTNHILTDLHLIMNKKKFDSLSKDQQTILREEAERYTTKALQTAAQTHDNAAYDRIKAKLKSVDTPDTASFRASTKVVWEGFLAKNPEARAWVDFIAATK